MIRKFSLARPQPFFSRHRRGPVCPCLRLALSRVPAFRAFLPARHVEQPIRMYAPISPHLVQSTQLTPPPDRTSKSIGLTQGPPEFEPLQGFDKYVLRTCVYLTRLDRKAISDGPLIALMAHFSRGHPLNSSHPAQEESRLTCVQCQSRRHSNRGTAAHNRPPQRARTRIFTKGLLPEYLGAALEE